MKKSLKLKIAVAVFSVLLYLLFGFANAELDFRQWKFETRAILAVFYGALLLLAFIDIFFQNDSN